MSCCDPEPDPETSSSCCAPENEEKKRRFDFFLWGSMIGVSVAIALTFLPSFESLAGEKVIEFCASVRELWGQMWWGLLLGILAVAVLQFIPQRAVDRCLGTERGFVGLLRAVVAGVVFDVCSHGVLLISMQLYRRGLSLGQTMAFLIASPWNSFSLTLILIALLGWKWTLVFIVVSMVIALFTGMIFSFLVKIGKLPANHHRLDEADAENEPGFVEKFKIARHAPTGWWGIIRSAFEESRMILRWILFGILLAALIRVIFDPATFAEWFGPTVAGLFLTLLATTLIEVCSEGGSPVAADLLTRANAPGNALTFLMAGVATDYTEILSVKDTMKSWKIALMIPAITVPQILVIGWLMNRFAS